MTPTAGGLSASEDWLGYPAEDPKAGAAGLRAGLGSAGRAPRSPNASLGAPWERPGSSGLHRASTQGSQGFHLNQQPRPSSRSAAEALHASAEHFPNPMVSSELGLALGLALGALTQALG